MNEIPMSEDDGYSLQQQQEQEQWEQHQKDLKELEKLLGDGAIISERFNHIFNEFKTGVNHVRQDK